MPISKPKGGLTATKRIGRPSRAEASAKALTAFLFDPAKVDPKAILATIAADTSAPATARVAACRALLAKPGEPEEGDDRSKSDPVTTLALSLLTKGKVQ